MSSDAAAGAAAALAQGIDEADGDNGAATQQPQQPQLYGSGGDEAVERQRQEVELRAAATFSAVADYVKGEMAANTLEYELMENLNKASADKYGALADTAASLSATAGALHGVHERFLPHLRQIDALDAQCGDLEAMVAGLDEYTKILEDKVQRI